MLPPDFDDRWQHAARSSVDHSCGIHRTIGLEQFPSWGPVLVSWAIIAGAVLAFGGKAPLQNFDPTTISYIVMGSGVLVILLALLIFMPRTRRSRSTAITTDAYGRQDVVERDDRISGP